MRQKQHLPPAVRPVNLAFFEGANAGATLSSKLEPLPLGRKYISIQLLSGHCLHMDTDVKATTAEILYVACAEAQIKEPRLFGLAIVTSEGDSQFLPYAQKIGKSAPKSWKTVQDKNIEKPSLLLHLQVAVYIDCISFLGDGISLQHYYLQLRQNVLKHWQLYCVSEERVFDVSAFALQADFGDYSSEKHTDGYFKTENYFPSWVVQLRTPSYILQHMPAMHEDLAGLSCSEAMARYCREVSAGPAPVNMHLCGLRKQKHSATDDAFLGITEKGLTVYERKEGNEPFCIASLRWQQVGQLCFDRKKFSLSDLSEHRFFFYCSSIERARNILSLCQAMHQVVLSLHSELTAARQMESANLKSLENRTFRESYVYSDRSELLQLQNGKSAENGSFQNIFPSTFNGNIGQRVSVVSDVSSNTTSGIVSDKQHNNDESEPDDDDIELGASLLGCSSLVSELSLSSPQGTRDSLYGSSSQTSGDFVPVFSDGASQHSPSIGGSLRQINLANAFNVVYSCGGVGGVTALTCGDKLALRKISDATYSQTSSSTTCQDRSSGPCSEHTTVTAGSEDTGSVTTTMAKFEDLCDHDSMASELPCRVDSLFYERRSASAQPCLSFCLRADSTDLISNEINCNNNDRETPTPEHSSHRSQEQQDISQSLKSETKTGYTTSNEQKTRLSHYQPGRKHDRGSLKEASLQTSQYFVMDKATAIDADIDGNISNINSAEELKKVHTVSTQTSSPFLSSKHRQTGSEESTFATDVRVFESCHASDNDLLLRNNRDLAKLEDISHKLKEQLEKRSASLFFPPSGALNLNPEMLAAQRRLSCLEMSSASSATPYLPPPYSVAIAVAPSSLYVSNPNIATPLSHSSIALPVTSVVKKPPQYDQVMQQRGCHSKVPHSRTDKRWASVVSETAAHLLPEIQQASSDPSLAGSSPSIGTINYNQSNQRQNVSSNHYSGSSFLYSDDKFRKISSQYPGTTALQNRGQITAPSGGPYQKNVHVRNVPLPSRYHPAPHHYNNGMSSRKHALHGADHVAPCNAAAINRTQSMPEHVAKTRHWKQRYKEGRIDECGGGHSSGYSQRPAKSAKDSRSESFNGDKQRLSATNGFCEQCCEDHSTSNVDLNQLKDLSVALGLPFLQALCSDRYSLQSLPAGNEHDNDCDHNITDSTTDNVEQRIIDDNEYHSAHTVSIPSHTNPLPATSTRCSIQPQDALPDSVCTTPSPPFYSLSPPARQAQPLGAVPPGPLSAASFAYLPTSATPGCGGTYFGATLPPPLYYSSEPFAFVNGGRALPAAPSLPASGDLNSKIMALSSPNLLLECQQGSTNYAYNKYIAPIKVLGAIYDMY